MARFLNGVVTHWLWVTRWVLMDAIEKKSGRLRRVRSSVTHREHGKWRAFGRVNRGSCRVGRLKN